MTTSSHFNGLTPREAERLALLAEECAETIQAVMKANRHGLDSSSPLVPLSPSNRDDIAKEAGEVMAALDMLYESGVLNPADVERARARKLQSVKRWLHHG